MHFRFKACFEAKDYKKKNSPNANHEWKQHKFLFYFILFGDMTEIHSAAKKQYKNSQHSRFRSKEKQKDQQTTTRLNYKETSELTEVTTKNFAC